MSGVRAVRAAAAILVVAAAGIAVPRPAQAAGTDGYCPDATGVTVVVDFHELGGGVVVRCAPGVQGSGLTALKSAGFTVAGTNRWGEAFICRINGKPGVGTEPCVDTPPATAYWSYWHAPNGGGWTYSDKGVKNRTPPAGSFDGWSFSKNHTEGTAPRPGVTPSRPAPPAPPPPQPNPTTPKATAGAVRTTAAAPTTAAPASENAAASAPTATAETTTLLAPPMGSSTAPPAPQSEADATPTGSAVPTGTLVGGGVLLLLAAAGGITAWRRRRPSTEGS